MVNLDPVALFSGYLVTTSSEKHLEDFSHAHIVSLLYKLISSSKDSDDLDIGLDRDRGRRQREINNNKNIKGKTHLRIMLRDILGFAEHQEKGAFGLGYKLILTRNKDSAVLSKDNGTSEVKIKSNSIEWYVPHYTPCVQQQALLSNQILSKTPT